MATNPPRPSHPNDGLTLTIPTGTSIHVQAGDQFHITTAYGTYTLREYYGEIQVSKQEPFGDRLHLIPVSGNVAAFK